MIGEKTFRAHATERSTKKVPSQERPPKPTERPKPELASEQDIGEGATGRFAETLEAEAQKTQRYGESQAIDTRDIPEDITFEQAAESFEKQLVNIQSLDFDSNDMPSSVKAICQIEELLGEIAKLRTKKPTGEVTHAQSQLGQIEVDATNWKDFLLNAMSLLKWPRSAKSEIRRALATRVSETLGLPNDPHVRSFEDRWLIRKELGKGGMGAVYAAEPIDVGPPCAIKFLQIADQNALGPAPKDSMNYHTGNLDDKKTQSDEVKMFLREARVMSKMRHENIVSIYDVDGSEKGMWMAQELVEGETLHSLMIKRDLNYRDMMDIALKVTKGLQAAHWMNIIHRDIKPHNIFISNSWSDKRSSGDVKVGDFGLGKSLTDTTVLNERGSKSPGHGLDIYKTERADAVGTPRYFSPEQAGFKPAGKLSDIYSLGITLYELFAGDIPFPSRKDTKEILEQRITIDPINILEKKKDLPEGLARLIMQMIEKDPAKRPQSIDEVAVRLKKIKYRVAPAKTAAQ